MGHEGGRQSTAGRVALGEDVREAYAVPAAAARGSGASDRVRGPLAEAVTETARGTQPAARPRKGGRQFRRAYWAPLTLPDRQGAAPPTIRYGCRPPGEVDELGRTLAHAGGALVRRQPVLGVILRAAGAPGLGKRLSAPLNAATLGVPVRQLGELGPR
jgi:hypothetical protein